MPGQNGNPAGIETRRRSRTGLNKRGTGLKKRDDQDEAGDKRANSSQHFVPPVFQLFQKKRNGAKTENSSMT
jgi:hypothetical protein